MSKQIYLAHNFGSRFKVRDEITPIIEDMYPDYKILNPFMAPGRHNEGLYETEDSSEKNATNRALRFGDTIDQRNKELVERDLGHIDESDLLVAYIERISAGTSMEIMYAAKIRGIPIHLVFDTDIDLFYHPFLNYFANKVIRLDEMGITVKTDGSPIDLKVLEAFKKYTDEIALLLAKKNIGYKDSASDLSYAMINGRITEKTKRINNIVFGDAEDDGVENLRDTIFDIGGYAVIQVMCHDRAYPFVNGFDGTSPLRGVSDETLREELERRGYITISKEIRT